jgi:hypothetical protein
MLKDENIKLKNKIAELKERITQIYSQFAVDATKSRVFENEFSLYLKACDHARNERLEGIRLQYDVTKFGLVISTLVLAFTVYIFNLHIISGMLIFLGFGFILCGFMYLLLAGEIRIARAGEYCRGLETFFKRHRWSTEKDEAVNLPSIPLWEEYRSKWEEDLFPEGPYGKTAVYAPFRIAMTLIDLCAIVYLIYIFIARRPEISWFLLIISCIVWILAVTVQMLLVNGIINKVDGKLAPEKERLSEYQKREIGWQPNTWMIIVRLFFNQDIIFPKKKKEKIEVLADFEKPER